jgi:N-acetylglutamate synthase/N-acetylornithine aminotransferase
MKDAIDMARITARELSMLQEHVLVGSTGRIGVPLPMAHVRNGLLDAALLLDNSPRCADHAAEAIMTSDTRKKQIAVEFQLGGRTARLGGMCKGAGMIQPGMSVTGARPATVPRGLHATMLCFLTTDAAIEAKPLQAALDEAIANSFNRITVDGDMSTNDTVLVLANGLAENPPLVAAEVRSRDIPNRVEPRLSRVGEDDRARWRRRAPCGDREGEWSEDFCGSGCRRARGGEQPAGKNKLARRGSQLGQNQNHRRPRL